VKLDHVMTLSLSYANTDLWCSRCKIHRFVASPFHHISQRPRSLYFQLFVRASFLVLSTVSLAFPSPYNISTHPKSQTGRLLGINIPPSYANISLLTQYFAADVFRSDCNILHFARCHFRAQKSPNFQGPTLPMTLEMDFPRIKTITSRTI
jgi:hypothetical protein